MKKNNVGGCSIITYWAQQGETQPLEKRASSATLNALRAPPRSSAGIPTCVVMYRRTDPLLIPQAKLPEKTRPLPDNSMQKRACFTCTGQMYIAHSIYYPRTCSFSFSLPKRNSDSGSLRRLFPPSPLRYVLSCLSREIRLQPFVPSSTRIELRLPTLLGALSR